MGMFRNTAPPALPHATKLYDEQYINQLISALRLYFGRISAVQDINISSLNINIDALPTEADVATLRSGDVYRDTTASNVLKVKV